VFQNPNHAQKSNPLEHRIGGIEVATGESVHPEPVFFGIISTGDLKDGHTLRLPLVPGTAAALSL